MSFLVPILFLLCISCSEVNIRVCFGVCAIYKYLGGCSPDNSFQDILVRLGLMRLVVFCKAFVNVHELKLPINNKYLAFLLPVCQKPELLAKNKDFNRMSNVWESFQPCFSRPPLIIPTKYLRMCHYFGTGLNFKHPFVMSPVYLSKILSMSELAYWNSLLCELKMTTAISQSQRTDSS